MKLSMITNKDKRITTYSQAERVTKDRKRPPAVGWPLPESKKGGGGNGLPVRCKYIIAYHYFSLIFAEMQTSY